MSPGKTRSRVVRDAYAYCERMARTHYENFPVASFLIPASKRRHVWTVYAFARRADDFADEGSLTPEERLSKLDDWCAQLDACYRGAAAHPVFIALAETAAATGIPRQLLADLLTAFRMDVTVRRYATYDDLLGYCRFSANPVGRLVLRIFERTDERNMVQSDSICTALQLTNFWQDVAPDWQKSRIYLPLEDMSRFGYTESDLGRGLVDTRFRDLMKFQVDRTIGLFREGTPLVREAPSSLRLELALTVNGGMTILRKIARASFDVLSRRPILTTTDYAGILLASLFRKIV